MAKTQNTTTLSPLRFVTGAPIDAEEAAAVAEQLNWSAGNRMQTHFSLTIAPSAWGTTDSPDTLGIKFESIATGVVERIRCRVRINPDAVNVTIGARCQLDAGNTSNLKFTVGGANTTISFTNADNGAEKTASLATASTGTGWQTVTIELERTAGTTADQYPRNIRLTENVVTSSLPSPVNE